MENILFDRATLSSILFVVIIASFIGFCIENSWISIRFGYADNRGMNLPFLFGYGVAVAGIYSLFGLPASPRLFGHTISWQSHYELAYALIIFMTVLIGESSFGYIIEYFTKIKWWDYTSIPLHLGRYTSIPTSIGFTAAICFFMDKCFPALYSLGNLLYIKGASAFIYIGVIFLIFDNLHALIYMSKHHETYQKWKHENHLSGILKLLPEK